MTDIEIAKKAGKLNIKDIASKLNISDDNLIMYGNDKAKITLEKGSLNGKIILVTAINPTPYGEGKTTVSIGLGDALSKLNKNVCITLREPSMGPVFGLKGGATGGGYSQVIPMEDINLHFTGDMHAITEANNLIAAAIDNHIFRGNDLDIQKVVFKRCIDVNDRALRNISLENRKDSFCITAASEIMAILCLAEDLKDLKRRLSNIVIGYNSENKFIYAKDLKIEGALTVILKDAFYPNLVQTLENTPVIIHGGPFANIAHGCNSIKATKLARSLSDYVITEAGFGADLGAEKFIDIKCRKANIKPDCVILVATVKALKYNDITNSNNLKNGLSNLAAHINNLKKTNSNIVVCLNKYIDDTEEEINIIKDFCNNKSIKFAISSAYIDGGEGAIDLANMVLDTLDSENDFNYYYSSSDSIKEKIEKLSKNVYNAKDVEYTKEVQEKIDYLEKNNLSHLPICVAKTQYSLSDDKNKVGYPEKYTIHIKNIELYNGAEFITIFTGNIIDMPGLPNHSNYEEIGIDDNNDIYGIS